MFVESVIGVEIDIKITFQRELLGNRICNSYVIEVVTFSYIKEVESANRLGNILKSVKRDTRVLGKFQAVLFFCTRAL